ncbi:galactose-6-phosphate isomerase subunit LacA [Carnobacterium gallinarum]|uniref:galactose-6-phosphate isomerase subunit LacA n=1 Tax=Carnobacterium gallinarum TaxID=2749 RepID=UPI000558C088|nr:galactose-6-phosphate isomerase subunit LacA [Carnobacterium gallinarum]
MNILIGSDQSGLDLKNEVKDYLSALGYEVIDKTLLGATDFVDSTVAVTTGLINQEGELGILFDRTGAGSFIAASKIKGVVAAEVSDEHSAKMTREHNGARVIVMGAEIVGSDLAKACAKAFVETHYAAGRHQVRVDMLNKML